MRWLSNHRSRVPTAQGKWPKKFPVRENTGNLGILPNTGNFVCSICKFPDAKDKGYCHICRKKFQFSFKKPDRSADSVLCM